jgi:hypothetical protein
MRVSRTDGLLAYRGGPHSQNGEDGVLAEIFRRLEIDSGWCVEFGAWDGRYLSNTFALVERGWQAVHIEADPGRFQDLLETARQYPAITPIQAVVEPSGPSSLDELLPSTPVPSDFDLLSVDIDGLDWQVWHGLRRYQPKVVLIEVNSEIPPPTEQIHGDGRQGSSLESMTKLAREKGYTLACHTGNAHYVRDDLVAKLDLDTSAPADLFIPEWMPGTDRPNGV